MARKRRLLILGPSFRRKKSVEPLPALERYDGLFYRVARKYLDKVKDVDIVVMIDDLTLVEGKTSVQYEEPEGRQWGQKKLQAKVVNDGRTMNKIFLTRKLKKGKYGEVFLSMGKQYAEALPDLSQFGIGVVFPTTGGPGPKAQALKLWMHREE